MTEIDKEYLIPIDDISCPNCGRRYGHHNSLVETNTELCKPCFIKKPSSYNIKPKYVTGQKFIHFILDQF